MKSEQCAQKLQSSTQASSQGEQKINQSLDASPIQDAVSVSAPSNDSRKVSRQDIELVQNLIERCLQLYMNKDEVVKTLLTRARIEPAFTSLVWQKLEEGNADSFRAYYIRLKLKKQIVIFNQLLEHQYHLMKYPPVPPKIPLAPMPNGMHHPMPPVVGMQIGYPVLPHPQMHVQGHPHITAATAMSSCHVVNGVPAPAHLQPLRMSSTNDMVVDDTTVEDETPPQVVPPSSGEMAVSPASVASSGHFPFVDSDMVMETSVLDSEFTADVGADGGEGGGGGAGNSRDASFDQIPWDFSLSDLTADLSNLGGKFQFLFCKCFVLYIYIYMYNITRAGLLDKDVYVGDLEALGDYTGSPFLPSDSEILLDSPDQEDIEEFFADSMPGPPSLNEEKP